MNELLKDTYVFKLLFWKDATYNLVKAFLRYMYRRNSHERRIDPSYICNKSRSVTQTISLFLKGTGYCSVVITTITFQESTPQG